MGWVTKLDPRRCQFLLPERSRFSQIGHIIFRAVVALKTSVPFTCRFIACSSRIKVCQTDTQTDRPSTVTLAAHARRGLIMTTRLLTTTRLRKSLQANSHSEQLTKRVSSMYSWNIPPSSVLSRHWPGLGSRTAPTYIQGVHSSSDYLLK